MADEGRAADKQGEGPAPVGTGPRSSILDPRSSIFLIGPRGSGKSTVARLLAERLGWGWADADEALERCHGRSVRGIFESEGESGFRAKEADLLPELCSLERHVVATGGGVVLREANRALLRRSGWVVWLTADVDTLRRRTQADPSTPGRRPDLTVGGAEEVAEVLRLREPLYRACAHLRVDTAGRPPDEIVAEILAAWKSARAGMPDG